MVYLEFVILGAPVSNQVPGPNLQKWRAALAAKARSRWRKPLLTNNLRGIIINFHQRDTPSLDIDNMSKPILDSFEGIVYGDDRQIRQAEISHVPVVSAFVVAEASNLIVSAL